MACCYNLTRSLVLLFLLVGLVGVVLSGLVDFWWQKNYEDKFGAPVTVDQGLWRACGGVSTRLVQFKTCIERKSLLKFEGNGEQFNLDIVLVSLIGSAGLTFISLILIAISMCQKYPSKVMVLFHVIFLIIGTAGGVFGLVWALLKVSDQNQGWAFYVLYGANGSLIIAVALAFVLLCARAPGYYLVAKHEA